jgi:FkbM family methyltransferase
MPASGETVDPADDARSWAERSADDRYRFWAQMTAAQARNTGRPSEAIDRRVQRFFREMCTDIRPTITLELGAHEASFSRWAKRSFPEARAVAVEANPYVHEKYRERLTAEGVEYHHLAAASTNGPVTITIPTQVGTRTLGKANRMASLAIHQDEHGHESVEVDAKRMDDFVSFDDDDRVVAWIDVEGASDQVLAGSSELLRRADAIYIEVEPAGKWHGQWLDVDVARFFHEIGKVPATRDIQRRTYYNVVYLDAALAAQEEVSERAARVMLWARRPAAPPEPRPSPWEALRARASHLGRRVRTTLRP